MTATTMFRASDGVRLFVAESGPSDAPLTVLLLHGWTEHHGVWDRVVRGIGDDLRVLAPDLRGHGRSDVAARGAATIERLADDVAELVAERVPGGRIVLAGHSLGGMTMMVLAERHPELLARVAGAAFVATSSGAMHDVLSRLPAPLAAGAALQRRSRALVKRLAPAKAGRPSSGDSAARGALPMRSRRMSEQVIRWAVFGSRASTADVRSTIAQAAETHRGNAAELSRSIRRHDGLAGLRGFAEVPSVVLVGERDRLTPPEHAHAIADALPHAQFVQYPAAGHMLPYERTDEVAAIIRRLATPVT